MTLIQPARAEKTREETESLNTVEPEIQPGIPPGEAYTHVPAEVRWRRQSGGPAAASVTR